MSTNGAGVDSGGPSHNQLSHYSDQLSTDCAGTTSADWAGVGSGGPSIAFDCTGRAGHGRQPTLFRARLLTGLVLTAEGLRSQLTSVLTQLFFVLTELVLY